MNDELSILRKIWLALSGKSIFFRLNTGSAWVGTGKPKRLSDGSILLHQARPIALGFSYTNGKTVTGAGDLIGCTTKIITQDMVGNKVGIFTSVEAKNSAGGRISKEQLQWDKNVKDAGGISIIANSVEDALEKIEKYAT